ncbi:hypothetical protein TWF694_007649 [Orbilia ellipsospora]|uniref:Uncharacterized protein n=1 Tax=Orbilia ellipsospora TaxID=2528407 RepID=A0AAV9XJV8_9PEZI
MSAIVPCQNLKDPQGNREIFEESFHVAHMHTIIKAFGNCKKLEKWVSKESHNIKDAAEALQEIQRELDTFLSEPHNVDIERYRENWEKEIENLGAEADKMAMLLPKRISQSKHLIKEAQKVDKAHKQKIAIVCEELPKFFWANGEPLKALLRFSKHIKFLLEEIPDIIEEELNMMAENRAVLRAVAKCREALLDIVNKAIKEYEGRNLLTSLNLELELDEGPRAFRRSLPGEFYSSCAAYKLEGESHL